MADAGRVIAGRARGIRLAAPGPGTRPLTDRVKQTLFGILDPDLEGALVLDLFAGSGAAGIEALSRGAARAVFVDHDAGACRVIGENLRRTGLTAAARVLRRDVDAWLDAATDPDDAGPFDLAIVDPPYGSPDALARTLARVAGRVRPGGRVVAKHFWRDAPPARIGLLASDRERRFGETALTFYRRAAAPAGGDTADEAGEADEA
jgi:16S rRNA (guanine966-N2)-methyltransferase